MKQLMALVAAGIAAFSVAAQELPCGTSERTEQIVAYLKERAEHEPHDRAHVDASTVALNDGTFVLTGANGVMMNAHYDDLVGSTIEFQPVDATHYSLRHVAFAYVDPQSAPLRDFSAPGSPHYVQFKPQSTPLTLFGQTAPTLYLSEFNGIHLKAPDDVTTDQVDAIHAFAQRDPIVSPLLITTAKPSRLAWPTLYAEERDGSVIVTWRSEKGEIFGYDVQARLFTDGRIDFTYRSARAMRWGAPVISAGSPNTLRSIQIASVVDPPNDIATPSNAVLKPMVDIVSADVSRINDSDILRVQLKLAGAIDRTKLGSSEFLRYIIVFGQSGSAFFDIKADGSTQTAPIGTGFIANDNTGSYAGDTVTFYVSQSSLPVTTGSVSFQALTRVGASTTFDVARMTPTLTDAPIPFVQDLSATSNGTLLELPISEPFTLGALNPGQAWTIIKSQYPASDADIDALAVYQTFYTDIIFYAGAYSASGNPQVDGVALPSTTYGSGVARRANVMHMNTLGYGWNATDDLSGHVIMHEFGHRWLYFIRIKDATSSTSSALNPVSAHPAEYIDTPAAFTVHHDYDASVMGGGVFTQNSDGSFHVRAANFGYSWTDLYLMGLATPNEVPPWFYVANSSPALGPEYYPPDDINVTGLRTNVNVQQIIDALGPRKPAMADSPKKFHVLFAIVTDDGVEATPEQLAAVKKIRSIFETNFKIATGARADVRTDFAPPASKRRGASH